MHAEDATGVAGRGHRADRGKNCLCDRGSAIVVIVIVLLQYNVIVRRTMAAMVIVIVRR